jgi:hypothetical protein
MSFVFWVVFQYKDRTELWTTTTTTTANALTTTECKFMSRASGIALTTTEEKGNKLQVECVVFHSPRRLAGTGAATIHLDKALIIEYYLNGSG